MRTFTVEFLLCWNIFLGIGFISAENIEIAEREIGVADAQYAYPPPPGQPPPGHYPPYGQGQPPYGPPGFHQPQPAVSYVVEGKSCIHTTECEAPLTVLTCDKGKCICPTATLRWYRGKYGLNTVWDGAQRKCMSVKDSACDVHFPKSVYCAAGLNCKPDGKSGFGHCTTSHVSSANHMSYSYSHISVLAVVWMCYFFVK